MRKRFIGQFIGLLITALFSLSATTMAAAASNSNTTPTPPGGRVMTFVNQCPFPVWLAMSSGAAKSKLGDKNNPSKCNTTADCFYGSDINNPLQQCIARGKAGSACFWTTPKDVSGNKYQLATGATSTFTFPFLANADDATWNGAFAARTGCVATGNSLVCETADCGSDPNNPGACAPARGFMQPATEAEITFNNNSKGGTTRDFYDVEMVNGSNVPVQITPTAPQGTTLVTDNNPYTCGSPGAVNPSPQMGACNWNFNPPTKEFIHVSLIPGAASCTTDAQCPANSKTICGLSFNPKNPNGSKLQLTCGKFLGYWSPLQICGNDKMYTGAGPKPIVNCTALLKAPTQGYTNAYLYNCKPVKDLDPNHKGTTFFQSGYQGTTDTLTQENCCGCVNWDSLGLPVPPPPTTPSCYINNGTMSQNQQWLKIVLPAIKWAKQACPTAYTYPFDDMSSTFTCKTAPNNSFNKLNYTVTFCPGGKTGAPSSAAIVK